jgi:hypothetical protein
VAVDAALILARCECRADRPDQLDRLHSRGLNMTTLDQPGVSKTLSVEE